MDCIAHRGFAGVNPENTLPAVRDAVERADAVEVDLRRCASGELVVHHDETVDRTTDGSGRVADHTAEELASLSVDGFDAGVPTFAAVLDAVPGDVTVHAELKERGLGEETAAMAREVDPRVVVSSFDPAALREVDGPPTAFITTEADGAIERATSLGCRGLHLRTDAVTQSVVARAHEAGLVLNAWTVTSPEEVGALVDCGVDGVATDFPSCCPSRV
ncbi:MAG: glycerophosphodiester phosphodiesterase [Haloarculaceae archaeon]